MKSPFLTIAVIFTVLSFTACRKDSTVASSAPRVKTYTEDVTSPSLPTGHRVDSFALNYDEQGRLISLISITTPIDKIIYAYGNDSYTMDITGDDSTTLHVIGYLKNSMIDSTFSYSIDPDSSSEKFIYNSNNQLVLLKDYDYSAIPGNTELFRTTTYSYDVSGNLQTTDDGDIVTTYTYTNKITPVDFTFSPFLSSKSYYLPETITATSSYNNTTVTVTLTYVFDNEGRLIRTNGIGSDGSTYIKRYTYF